MKLGFSMWGVPDVPVAEVFPVVAAMGYQGVELTVLPGWTTAIENLGTDERRELRDLSAEHDLPITSIAAHCNLLDPESSPAGIARIKAALELAVELDPDNPPGICTFSGGDPVDWEDVREDLLSTFADLAGQAANAGAVLTLEAHVGCAMDRPEQLLWVLQELNNPAAALNFDYSHFQALDYTIEKSLGILIDYTVHTHIKGNRGLWPDNEFLTPGEPGDDYNYANYLTAFDNLGFNGFQTVEISMMVQRRDGYDWREHARTGYNTMVGAFADAGLQCGP